jgi:hypothetical protein
VQGKEQWIVLRVKALPLRRWRQDNPLKMRAEILAEIELW